MRISHKYRFVFLANPRTGSTTVRSILDHYSDIKSVHITQISERFPFYHYISAQEFKAIFEERGWDWSKYKKFCVIRNPYDRIVSLYHHGQQMKLKKSSHSPKAQLRFLKERVQYLVDSKKPFRDYVTSISPKNRLTTSLKEFVCDKKGDFLVDDILVFENLTSELQAYCKKIGLEFDSESVPYLNASQNRKFYTKYYDNLTKRRVASMYAYEIEQFGYDFKE